MSLSNFIKDILNIQDNNISVSTVQKILNNCYPNFKVNKEHLPKTICIDEFKSVKNIDGAMTLVLDDFQTKNSIR